MDLHTAAQRLGSVVSLVDMRGQLLLQSNVPRGERLPNLWDIESRGERIAWDGDSLPLSSQGTSRQAAETGAPVVSGLYLSLVARRPTVGGAYPVKRDGSVRYVLGYSFPTASLERFFASPQASALEVYLVDRNGAVIATAGASQVPVGSRLSGLPDGVGAPGQGVATSDARHGPRIVSAYSTSELTGWTVRVSQPLTTAWAPAVRATATWAVLFSNVVWTVGGVAIVWWRYSKLVIAR